MSGIEFGIGDFDIEDRDAYGEDEEYMEDEESMDEQDVFYDSPDFRLWYERPSRNVLLWMRGKLMTFRFKRDEWHELRLAVIFTWTPEVFYSERVLYNGEYCMIWVSQGFDPEDVIIWLQLKGQEQLLRFRPRDWAVFRSMMFTVRRSIPLIEED